MTNIEWQSFSEIRSSFKAYCIASIKEAGEEYILPFSHFVHRASPLKDAIKASVGCSQSYKIETPLVYNHSLDEIDQEREIKLILVTDNPGKEEQKSENQRYLVGQAGKLGDAFFKKHPELEIDFRKNVIILNKTILHTPKTLDLKKLIKQSNSILDFFEKDQKIEAKFALSLSSIFSCPIWILGYSQLGKNELFSSYSNAICAMADNTFPIYLYQHFSRNCFATQLKKEYEKTMSLQENLHILGLSNRRRILGF